MPLLFMLGKDKINYLDIFLISKLISNKNVDTVKLR